MNTRHSDIELIADGTRRETLVDSTRVLWAHAEVVWSFFRRSLQVRYKQSVLGVLWAVIQPLATLGLFVVFFGKVVKISGGGVPYAAFAMSALAPWQFVSSAVNFGGNAVTNEASLLRKVYFPREAPVIGAIGSNLVDLGIMMVLLLIAEPLLGGHLGLSLLCAPLLIVVLILPVLAVSLPMAGLAVFYRDVKYILPFVIQFWMFASPVVYPLSRVPKNWWPLYAAVNPLVGPLDGFRRVFTLGAAPDWGLLGISAATGALALLAGYKWFKRLEPEMADVA